MGLKCDRFQGFCDVVDPLKSDQNGIEMKHAIPASWTLLGIKIRPKWD